eukprot:4437054-Pyramimonas_sp.AAC.1
MEQGGGSGTVTLNSPPLPVNSPPLPVNSPPWRDRSGTVTLTGRLYRPNQFTRLVSVTVPLRGRFAALGGRFAAEGGRFA